MDIEQVKKAFIKADDLAQKGDQTAAEDARYFANLIRSYKPPEEPSIGKRLMGGAAATGDFILNMVPDAAAGLYGLGKGTVDALTTDKSFSDAGADAVRAAQEKFGRNYAGRATDTEDTAAYKTAEEALATPGAAGTMAIQGLNALARLPFEGLDKTVQGLEEPWRNPIGSTIADTAGPLIGYGLAGRGAKAVGDATVQVKPFQRPEPIAEPLPETLSPLDYPRKAIDGPLKEGQDPTAFFPEGMTDPALTDAQQAARVIRQKRAGKKTQGQVDEGIPFEPTEDASWQSREIERPTSRRLLRESREKAEQRLSEKERMEAWERDANEKRYPDDIDEPLSFGLSLEDRPLREEARLAEKDAIERGREDFPTMDIDLLPEKVAKDSVIKGLITRWNNEQAKLRELYEQANQLGLEGTRVRAGELGTTKKAKGEINKLRDSIETLEKKLNNLSQQLQNRMTNRHGVDVEGLPLFKGVKEKGQTPEGKIEYTGGKFSEEPPSVVGPAERTTGLTVEKTERGNLQRSPDAKVTGSEMVQKTQRPPLGKGPGGRQSGGIDPSVFTEGLGKLFGRGNKKPANRPAPKAGTPITPYLLEDTRDLATFVKEEFPRAADWKDLTDSLYQKIVQGKFVASMARNLNPIAQFLTSKVVALDRMASVAKENALYGNQFVSNIRGWSKRIKSDTGALTFFQTAKKADARKLHQTLIEFDNAEELIQKGLDRPSEDMLRAKGLNNAQIKAANAVYDQIGKLFDEVNKLLTDAGKDPIKKLPGYIPHMWFGDYRVILKDKVTGEVLDVRGVNTKKQVEAMKAEMRKHFGDAAKYDISDFDATATKYKASDVSAFQYALSILSKGSPEHKLMNSVYKDIVAHRGFKSHGLQRKGAKGFAGSELTDSGLKDFTKALESYFNHGYNFIANQKKKQLYADLKKELDKGKVDLPNTRKFIDEYVDHSTGGLESQMTFIDNMIKGIGERTGQGPNAVKRGIQQMNALASFFFLSSGKFLEVNVVQPIYNWAKLRNIQLDFGGSNPTVTMAKAYMETFLGQATTKTKQGLTWAKQNGFIDAKTMELLDTKLGTKNMLGEFVYKGSKHTLGWWEQEAVRTPTFVMYDLALRDVIKNDKERWETAGALTDKYMVDYGKSESPFFYEKMGTVGEAARPLKQYGHAYYGQLGEYTKLAMEDKQYSPLAGFLGAQLAVSGVKGLPLVGTASALVMAINNYFGTSMQTPEDALLGSGLSDEMIFGPVSTITGQDLSGSVSAPGVEDVFSLPGVSFALNAGAAAAMFGGKMARGTVTDADIMKTIPKVVPNPHVTALTEKAFTENGVVPDPNNRMLPKLTNPRTPGEEMTRVLTGAQLTREQGEKAVINALKREEQSDSKVKKEVMDKVVDDFINGRETEDQIIERYQKAGGDVRNFLPELKGHMKKMIMGELQRKILQSPGLSTVHRIEKLKKYEQVLEDAGVEELAQILKD